MKKEDIEELGFTLGVGQLHLKSNQVLLYHNDNYTLGHHVKDNLITIFVTDPSKNGKFPEFIADSAKVTKIRIDNKEELEILLERLDIK
jgi:hypothetical protein